MGRAPCCDKANVKRGPWSPEEDEKLKAYIEKYGTGGNWIALPQKIGIKRCGKSCRLRWLNYLRPNIKHGGFTDEEDSIICSLYISIGSRWSIIAAQLPGRTDNDIKNYWNTKLKKKLLGKRKQSYKIPGQNDVNIGEENMSFNLQNLSSSALERLQLHMHLQTLQNPNFSFYNNPALLPKITIPTVHSPNDHDHRSLINLPAPIHCLEQEYDHHSLEKKMLVDSTTRSSSNVGIDSYSGFALDNLVLMNDTFSSFLPTESHDQFADQFDCLIKDNSHVLKDNVSWWPSDKLDVNSNSTTSSWDSGSMTDHQPEEMYQGYMV